MLSYSGILPGHRLPHHWASWVTGGTFPAEPEYGFFLLSTALVVTLWTAGGTAAVRLFEITAFLGPVLGFGLPAARAVPYGGSRSTEAMAWLSLALWAWAAAWWASQGSPDRYAAGEALLLLAAVVAQFWSARAWLGLGGNREWFLDCFAVWGTALVVVAVVQYWTVPGRVLWLWPAAYPDVFGPFANRNHFAAFAALVAAVAAFRKPRGAALAALALGCGLVSGSRAWSVLLALEAVWLGWLLVQRRGARAGVAWLALGLLAGWIVAGNVLVHRWRSAEVWEGRREIQAAAWSMAAARPWTGHGIGSFPWVYREFRTFDTGEEVEHAHNDWLELAAELGWPAAAGGLVLTGWIVRAGAVPGWGIGLALVAAHACVDYPLRRANLGIWVLLLAAAAVARPGGGRSRCVRETEGEEVNEAAVDEMDRFCPAGRDAGGGRAADDRERIG